MDRYIPDSQKDDEIATTFVKISDFMLMVYEFPL